MKQIGGFFTYEPLPEAENHYLENLCPPGGSLRFFMSGRCANYYALQDICLSDTKKVAYVPVYTCETVLAPIQRNLGVVSQQLNLEETRKEKLM